MIWVRILLTALAAKNIHKTLAPWCLKAYCDERIADCQITVQEHTINDSITRIAAKIYPVRPDLIGLSCYIWNIEQVKKVGSLLKKYLPSTIIVLGGPEVSFVADINDYPFADYIIQGPGEIQFARLIELLSRGETLNSRILEPLEDYSFPEIPSPYTPDFFQSFAAGKIPLMESQLIYYESSRGCSFSCTYCLSSATFGVKELPLERVYRDLNTLLSHGPKWIKFVDRTFNANQKRAKEILLFILAQKTDCTFHFEAAADLFDEDMLEIISKMPPGRIQFEIGIQSINPQTLQAINRKTDLNQAFSNICHLIDSGNCHIHLDLIAGLPYDTSETFSEAIDRCLSLRPHMLQLGFLKLLKGAGIARYLDDGKYIFSDFPPYEVHQSNAMTVEEIIALRKIEPVIDKFYNSGMFINSIDYAINKLFGSGYDFFRVLADYCDGHNELKVSLKTTYTILYNFLTLYGNETEAAHYIKLDCLIYDSRGMLPDAIAKARDKTKEHIFRQRSPEKYKNIRIEFFDFDQKPRVFIYDKKNKITKAHLYFEL